MEVCGAYRGDDTCILEIWTLALGRRGVGNVRVRTRGRLMISGVSGLRGGVACLADFETFVLNDGQSPGSTHLGGAALELGVACPHCRLHIFCFPRPILILSISILTAY